MEQYSLEDSPDDISLRDAWEHVLQRVSKEMTANAVERFIKPLQPVRLDGATAKFHAPGRFVHEWVKHRYQGVITDLLCDELGMTVSLELIASPHARPEMESERFTVTMPVNEVATFRPNPKFSFETFIVGQSNRLAYAGTKAVASDPGSKYNPLFIYGPSGLGKTHLLHAIAKEILARDPKASLAYVSAQQFTEDFVKALQSGRMEQFRKTQRNVGVWLVDDIQFIASRDKTQEEVFHTFNYLQSLNKQIVLTSDRPPRDLSTMDERLRTRFESGLVVDIQLPDTETRSAIVLSKAKQEGIELDTEVAMYLAEHVPGNIRILEGALTRLVVQSSVSGVPVNREFAETMIAQYYKTGFSVKPAFTTILEAVSKHYRIRVEDIRGTRRNAPIVHARHVAVFLTRELTHDSWKHIGTLFGDRDHTSMMHGYNKIAELMKYDKELRVSVKTLIRGLHIED